jgi:hypothetical protein
MRRALAAVCLVLPACLSGFSEIRIARPDAGTVDSARADTPAPADAPQSLSDALDALVVPDAQVTPMDAPEVAVPVDVVAGPDVHDVGAVGVDVQDVPDELPTMRAHSQTAWTWWARWTSRLCSTCSARLRSATVSA